VTDLTPPPGREGEVFGLYATTGRAAIWLSPALYAAAIALSPATSLGEKGLELLP
jgi:UMF1 family MFS transporter